MGKTHVAMTDFLQSLLEGITALDHICHYFMLVSSLINMLFFSSVDLRIM